MKKLAAAALTITMALSMSTPAYATEIGGLTNGSADIKATYEAGTTTKDTVYSVDIEWGSLEYTYSPNVKKVWDPDELIYKEIDTDGPSWTCSDGADKIKVTNNSNAPITESLSYEPVSGGSVSYVEGAFDKKDIRLESAEGTTVDNAPSDTATLELTGELKSDATTATKIGTVKVEITNNSIYKYTGSTLSGFLKTTAEDNIYTADIECTGTSIESELFCFLDSRIDPWISSRSERYNVVKGITGEGVYALQKATWYARDWGVNIPTTPGQTLRLTVDFSDANNPTLTVQLLD